MSARYLKIFGIAFLALSSCSDQKAAGDKAAADIKAAAAAKKDPAAAKGAKAKKGAKVQGEDETPPVLAVPEGFTYEVKGRRDPFVNPVPQAAEPPPEVTKIQRPEGLPGVAVSEAKVTGVYIQPGMTRAIITVGKKTYFAIKGETLFDGVIKDIRPDGVVFTMISPLTKQPVNQEKIVKTGTTGTAGEKK